jgi:hypothetical protein
VSPAANGARGEVIAVLAGEPRRLCLTLGALAEIETALDLASVADLGARLRAPSAGDLLVVLVALLRGGGEVEAAAALDRLAVSPAEAAAAVAAAFAAAA